MSRAIKAAWWLSTPVPAGGSGSVTCRRYRVSVGFGNVYVADDDGTVSAFLRNGQGVRWQNIDLGFRELSRPTPVNSYVATVDFEGYLHLLSQVDGEIVGRTKVDSKGARADMIARGNRLFVYTNDGALKAYDVEARN